MWRGDFFTPIFFNKRTTKAVFKKKKKMFVLSNLVTHLISYSLLSNYSTNLYMGHMN